MKNKNIKNVNNIKSNNNIKVLKKGKEAKDIGLSYSCCRKSQRLTIQ